MSDGITKELNLRILKMCEEILPNTRMANSSKLKKLLEDIRSQLEGDK